jgi:hypothetical protein
LAISTKQGRLIMIDTQNKIKQVINSLEQTLLEKNKRYGNSALEPINIFCKLSASNGIQQRLDDKLMRIKNSNELRKNDVFDLMGYLVLLSVANKWEFNDLID